MEPGKIVYRGKTKKGNEIYIRYPQETDVSFFLDFYNAASKEKTFIRNQGELLTQAEEEKYVKDLLKKIRDSKAVKLLAFIDDKLVGAADIKLQDKVEEHVGIFGIIVAKEFRGEGIGKLLMNLVFEEAKKNIKDLKIVTLGCFANNIGACMMYKSFGFKEYGNLPEGLIHKGQYVDHIYMYKKIE